jgi:hypothetical protein
MFEEQFDWDEILPADIPLDDMPKSRREELSGAVLSRVADLLRTPRTLDQLVSVLGADLAEVRGLVAVLRAADLVDELPGHPAPAFRLRTPLIAFHSRRTDAARHLVSQVARSLEGLTENPAGQGVDEIRVDRILRTTTHPVDLDVLVAEIRSAVAGTCDGDPGAPRAGSPADLEVHIVVVKRRPAP